MKWAECAVPAAGFFEGEIVAEDCHRIDDRFKLCKKIFAGRHTEIIGQNKIGDRTKVVLIRQP